VNAGVIAKLVGNGNYWLWRLRWTN